MLAAFVACILTSCLRSLFADIYLHKNKTLIHNSLYVFDNWGGDLRHKKR